MGEPYHHGDLPRAIIAAGRAELRLSTSPAALSIGALARRVGVSAAAPYRHFPDRAALLSAIAAAGYRDAAARLSPGAGAAVVGRVWARFLVEEPALATLMVTVTPEGELAVAVREWLGAVASALELEEGGDPVALLQHAVGVWAGVHGLTSLREGGYLAGFDAWLLPDPATLAERIAGG